jgi:uncharacterized protein (DUF362 family)
VDTVSIVKATQPSRLMVAHLLDMLEHLDIGSGDSVVVKPNICYHRDPSGAIVTNFGLIEAVLEWLKERSRRVVVVESDNRTGTADYRVKTLGLDEVLRRVDVPFVNLSREKEVITENVEDVEFHVPALVANADCVVNLPKMKTCAGMTVTLSLKNSFGLVADRNKPPMHRHLDRILLKVNRLLRRQLVVVDGIVGMEGNGPLLGEPVRTKVIVAGMRPASVDAVCSRIMGFDPAQINHIRTCSEGGLGDLAADKINVVGEDLKAVAKHYAPPSFAPKTVAKTLRTAARLYLAK